MSEPLPIDGAPSPPSCWRCGGALREGVRFCGLCGIALRSEDFLALPPRSAPRPGLGVALGTYFLVLVALIGLMLAEVDSVRTLIAFDVGLVGVGVALTLAFWQDLGPLLGAPSRLDLRALSVTLVALAGVFGLVQVLAALMPALFVDLMANYRAEGVGLGFAVFQIGPLTALGEELLFRGAILTGLRRTFPERAAISVSAAMFATIHLSPVAFLHTGALGVLLGWLVVRTGSLWPAILVHAAWNSAMVLLDA